MTEELPDLQPLVDRFIETIRYDNDNGTHETAHLLQVSRYSYPDTRLAFSRALEIVNREEQEGE